ncbi:MAG: hypothetical protein GY795_16900 [Desulfobacterales bacterium]|nr:hypothetical protein [Desulfobacterales bacterium]
MSKFSNAIAEKKVFISYAKEDYEIAKKLYRDLIIWYYRSQMKNFEQHLRKYS